MIFINHHIAGLCNQILNFEIAAGMAYLNNGATIYGFHKILKRDDYFYNKLVINKDTEDLFLTDIFDYPDIPLYLDEEYVYIEDMPSYNLVDIYFSVDKTPNEEFADGRTLLLPGKMHFPQNYLATYCRIFANRTKEFDTMLSQIKPKKEYLDFASLVTEALGRFNGIHLRRGDHTGVVDVPGSSVSNAVNSFADGLPVLIATDDPDEVAGITGKIVLAEKYVLTNFLKEFEALPRHDQNVLALVVNLILAQAEKFVGTRTSTYTGYIHRQRLISGKELDMNFLNNDDYKIKENSKYSWDDYHMEHLEKNYREWKEAKLIS
ncbi:MAG: hypothetical protein RLZZ196_179 [Bacteroidota bacterium]|jgi:hypothetical protein